MDPAMDPAMAGGAPAPGAQGIPPEELEAVIMQLAEGMEQMAQALEQQQQQTQMLEQGLQEITQALQAPGGM
jgi:uncharacterized membrane protein YccC